MDEFNELVRAEQDPARRSRLLCAAMISNRHTPLPWYDSKINNAISMARRYLGQVAPGSVEQFDRRLAVFRADPQLQLAAHKDFLPPQELGDLLAFLDSVDPATFKTREIESLGRHRLNNLAVFEPARDLARALLEARIGRTLRPTYTMFVRYYSNGKLPVHLDSFDSQYSVGLCLNRGASWPMHCSSMLAQPHALDLAGWSEQAVLDDRALTWTTIDPEPNEAFVFAPANQWHWRDAIGAGHDRPYDMLYFSFVAPDAYDLLYPAQWVTGFGIPELADLATVLAIADKAKREPT